MGQEQLVPGTSHLIDLAAFDLADKRARAATQARARVLYAAAVSCRDNGLSIRQTAAEMRVSKNSIARALLSNPPPTDEAGQAALNDIWRIVYPPATDPLDPDL